MVNKQIRSRPNGYPQLNAFRNAQNQKAIWQLINTLAPYGCLWYLMIRSVQLGYSYALALVLAVIAAAFLVRVFILFHDCVHGSFFTSRSVNTFFGYLLGLLVFTSFEDWRFSHLRHHVTYANLDTRGYGDIWTMTRTEFNNSTVLKRLQYRLYRNPVVLFGLGAFFIFLLSNLACRGGRHLAVLRAAPVCGSLLGAKRPVGLISRGYGRLFVLQVTGYPALVFRKHRVSPCTPSGSENTQLPSKEVL